jgi:hypothetical protein
MGPLAHTPPSVVMVSMVYRRANDIMKESASGKEKHRPRGMTSGDPET